LEFFETLTSGSGFNSYITQPITDESNKYEKSLLNKSAKELSNYYSSSQLETIKQFKENIKLDKNISEENKIPCIDYNPCKHGTCHMNETTKGFSCECNASFMGPFCDILKHPCDFKPCLNGVCEIISNTNYRCLCKPNFSGENCQIGQY
jgi:hypothetical protein